MGAIRRKWLGATISTCVALALIGLGVWHWMDSVPRLNVILVTLDTTRADRIGCYGHADALTPTLDTWATNGVLFERAYTPAPLTLPSHASMHTGLYPAEHGLFTNGKSRLDAQIPTLAETLTARGYATGAFVASFVLNSRFGLNRGFQTYDDALYGAASAEHGVHRQRSADAVLDAAIPWLTAKANKPFFCWLHLYDPHHPYLEHRELFGDRFIENPYDAEIAFMDAQLQRLAKFLEDRKLAERTIVVVVGDHGEGLGDHQERGHGSMLYDSTLHVPLIVSLPEKFRTGTRVATPVSLIDFCPTLLDCLEVRPRGPMSGRSLKPALLGDTLAPGPCYSGSDELFLAEGWSPLRCLITDEWKYIQTTKPELYDLRSDPGETKNLLEDPNAPLHELRQRLSDIEAQMVRREGQSVHLTAKERSILTSLGYLGGESARDIAKPTDGDANRPELTDVKDMIESINAWQDAQEFLEHGQFDPAVVILQTLVGDAPRYLSPRLLLGQVLASRGQIREAMSQYREVLDIDPDNRDANAHYGNMLATEARFHDALPFLLKALQRDPEAADLHFITGRVLGILGRSEEAVSHYEAAARFDPNFVDAQLKLGEVRTQEGKTAEALAHYETAARLDPNSVAAQSALAQALSTGRRHGEAAKHFRRAIELDPGNTDLRCSLATELIEQKKPTEAIEQLSEALRLQPAHRPAAALLEQARKTQFR